MAETLAYLWPEVTLFLATCVVMVVGLSPSAAVRKLCPLICGLSLAAAGIFAIGTTPTGADHARGLMPGMLPYAKAIIAAVGILLVMLLAGTVDREEEANIEGGRPFDPLRLTSGEFYSFFLFSLTGLMLTASADTLIWLFLALELTSLPTYVMVTISTARSKSREAGVKYFFLGALGAAIFLYGFTLIYGGTGSVHLTEIQRNITMQMAGGGLNPITLAGLLLAITGIGFKIAAVPMHYYTADVYQGAATSVTAMLAFVPKTAGFLALMLLCSAVGWHYGLGGEGLPDPIRLLLWVMAVMSMTLGNVLALLQTSMKRMLAYSSIAHSGYMLVGIIAGPGPEGGKFYENGLAAVLFYLFTYGVMTVGTFAVLASLEHRNGKEADHIDDIRGICKSHPVLGWTLVITVLSTLGFPPLLGFIGKLGLFTAGISGGHFALIVVLGINSAIAACYYLRLIAAAYIDDSEKAKDPVYATPFFMRPIAGVLSAGGVLLFMVYSGPIVDGALNAASYNAPVPAPHHDEHHAQDQSPNDEVAIISDSHED